MRFVKMHGLGNDFVIVPYDSVFHLNIPYIASQISNRKIGIGCDQFLVYKSLDQHSKYQLWIYNIDGSLTGACGNAMRCMMKLLYIEFGVTEAEFEVLGRKIHCKVLSDDKFQANMGRVSFEKEWMPEQQKILKVLPYKNVNALTCADIGNKHLVLFLDKITDEESWKLGQVMEKALYDGEFLFSEGVNVNIALRVIDGINLNVWERQVGFTGACGSGACVTVAAAIKFGYIKDKAIVHFSNGSLDISMQDGEMYMAGPATFVASGEFKIF